MSATPEQLWQRFQQHYTEFPSRGLALDMSRLPFNFGGLFVDRDFVLPDAILSECGLRDVCGVFEDRLDTVIAKRLVIVLVTLLEEVVRNLGLVHALKKQLEDHLHGFDPIRFDTVSQTIAGCFLVAGRHEGCRLAARRRQRLAG